jgi:hypothetical protein
MEMLKIIIFVVCVGGIGVWGIWIAFRAEDRKEAADKKD